MSQYLLPFIDPDIVTGSQLAQWLNQWAPAIQTAQTGSSRPASVTAGFLWLEQVSPTVWNYKLFDGTDDIILLTVNPTTNAVSVPGMGTLGTAAAADIITSQTDSTAGRVITVGGGGLLGNAPFAADANAITSSLFSSVTAGTTNIPVAQTGTLFTIIDGTNGSQQYQSATTGNIYRRSRFGGAWGGWNEFWTTDNLVKTTSPTDTTAGRVTKVGDFGLGAVVALENVDDVSARNGFYSVSSVSAGTKPSGFTNGALIQFRRGDNVGTERISQIISDDGSARTWVRGYLGNWTPWVEVATSANSLGQSQTWTDVTASRVAGTTYTNSTGKPIEVSITGQANPGTQATTLYVSGLAVSAFADGTSSVKNTMTVSAVVPNAATYSVTVSGGGILRWMELR